MSLSLCMVLGSVLISFSYISCPVFPELFIEKAVFTPLYILASFVKNKVPIGLFLGFLSCSIGPYFCFCASNILSWWLWKWKWSRSVVSNSLWPMDCSPSGSSVHGIFQARILECVAIFSFKGSSRPRDGTHISCISSIGRRIIYHWDTREAQNMELDYQNFYSISRNSRYLQGGISISFKFQTENKWPFWSKFE